MSVQAPPSFPLVTNGNIAGVAASLMRKVSSAQAMAYAAITDVAHRDPKATPDSVSYRGDPAEFAADELRILCGWTRCRADREAVFAVWLTREFPDIWAALYDGRIDLAKARILHTYLTQVTPDEARQLCAELLPLAAEWTTSTLVARLRRRILTRDPVAARERYEQAIAARREVWYLNDNGTVSLVLDGLAPDTAAAAKRRIRALATQLRARGYPGTLPQIRADVLAALLDGTLEGLTRSQILDRLLDQAPAPEPTTNRPNPAGPNAARCVPVESVSESEPEVAPSGTPTSRPGANLTVRLDTLLGDNDQPGESTELHGPILPHIARRMAATQRGSLWTFAVCNSYGHLTCSGTTRQRPEHVTDTHRGGIVEIQLTETQLAHWRARPPPGWATVIADIGRLADQWPDTLARINSDPNRRFPSAELRRHIQLRDHTCQGPANCTTPARYCDWEHTIPFDAGGGTTTDNGRAQCRHDHLLKTRGGWTARPLPDGGLEWTSPLGQKYIARPQPLIQRDNDEPPF
jgi:hypothetical protein